MGRMRRAARASPEAANNGPQTPQPTKTHCAGQALKKNAVSLTLDAVGFVPGESTAATLFQVGVGVTSTVYSATQQDTSGSFMGIAGIQLTAFYPFATQAGWGIAKSVPIAGTLLNVVSTGKDAWGHAFCIQSDQQETIVVSPGPQALSSLDCNTLKLKVSGNDLANMPQARLNPHISGVLILFLKQSGGAHLSAGDKLSAKDSRAGTTAQRVE